MLVTKTTVCLEGKNTIQFKSNIDQAISDESWAFSNVMVWSAGDPSFFLLFFYFIGGGY
jgi:Gpi18-like mannosyltransferase